MKVSKLVLSAMISSVLILSTAFAAVASGNGSGSKAASQSVRSQIADVLTNLTNTGEVYVYFNTSAEQGFKVLKVAGTDVRLAEKVKNRLVAQKIEAPKGMEGDYVVKVSFKDHDTFAINMSSEDVLRNAIVTAVENIAASEPSTVIITFSITGNKLKVVKVSGYNKSFATLVERSLDNTEVNTTEKLAGNYQIKVNF